MALVYLGCFINAHTWASLPGVRMGIGWESLGGCCMSDPLDFLDSPGAQPWLLTQKLAFLL